MNTEFTQGPWFPHERLGSLRKCGVTAGAPYDPSKGAQRRIAWLGSASPCRSGDRYEEDMANAHLIAAAPDLYADLAVLVKAFGSTSEHGLWVRARDTLARARGEP